MLLPGTGFRNRHPSGWCSSGRNRNPRPGERNQACILALAAPGQGFSMLPLSGKAPIPGIVPMALGDSRDSLPWKLFEIPCNPERWISKGRFLDSACLSGCFPEKPYQNSKYWQSIYFCQSVGVLRCSIHGKSSSTLIYFNVPT